MVAASVLAGALAGVGGAAAYNSWDDQGSDSSSASAPSTIPQVSSTSTGSSSANGSVEAVAQKVLPSVVKLDVSGGGDAGSGSGIILSDDGLILTNNHVAEVAAEGGQITVSFNDGSKAEATIVGRDPLTDTALVQAKDVSGLTPATIGKSAELQVGEDVVAIGSPYGLDATVTSGIVSALERAVDVGADDAGNVTAYPAIQTDAAINPGNSGGALVNTEGHVVGINASIRTTGSSLGGEQGGSIGLGFAIPIDEVLPIIEQMKAGETPTHAKLGLSVSDVSETGATVVDGAKVGEISVGSAAQDAGLKDGDVITAIDDHAITGADSLVATVRSYRPGDKVEVTYSRGDDTNSVDLTLGSDAVTANS